MFKVKTHSVSSLPINYQWFFGDEIISGGTGSVLEVEGNTTSNIGEYRVRATDLSEHTVWSEVAQLEVSLPPPPIITVAPNNATADFGQTVSLNVVTEGIGPIEYQWFFNDTPLSDEVEDTLTIRNLIAEQAGEYRVEVTNPSGKFAISAPAILTVIVPLPPQIVQPLKDVSAAWGQDVRLSVIVQGTEPLSYKWLFEGVTLPGENRSTLSISNITTTQAGFYQVVVGNRTDVTLIEEAQLTVALPPPPVFVTQPQDVSASQEDSVNFTVGAIGEPPFIFQWYFNETPIQGQSSAILTIENLTTDHAGEYHVTVR